MMKVTIASYGLALVFGTAKAWVAIPPRRFLPVRSLTWIVTESKKNQDETCAIDSSTCLRQSSTSTAVDENPTAKLQDVSEAYKQFLHKLNTITQLRRVSTLLAYDQMVFMPEKAAPDRGEQMSVMAGLIHEKQTDMEFLKLIEQAQQDISMASAGDDDASLLYKDESRLLELQRKEYVQNARVSVELASKQAELKANAHGIWAKARETNDFALFESTLQECFGLAKQVADAKRDNDSISHYTQMLDEFEMGLSPDRIDQVFSEIQAALVPLIDKVLGDTATPPSTQPLEGEYPIDQQKELSRQIVTKLGFDDEFGRIDVSVHPFTMSLSASDVRITSRFCTDEWYQALAASIHEGGHAMYEQNLSNGGSTDLDSTLSMGVHESQSLFWERHVSLSKAFWQWAAPLVKEAFGEDRFDYTAEQVYGAVNAVSRSFIRVEADELTYPLHVILRYQIERDVIEGKLAVKDIPKRWNEQMKEMLHIDVPSDTKGCLQDVHWSMGAIGYFPTYLLGSAMAAQLAHYCQQDITDFDDKISRGEFLEIKAWLTDKVHRHGKRYHSLDALLEGEVGEPLNPKYFIDYLTEKYTDLYKC